MGAPTLQAVLAQLTDKEALAVWHALSQWSDNERCRDDVDESQLSPDLPVLAALCERMDLVVAGRLAGELTGTGTATPPSNALTVERLAHALDDAFEADQWGDVDPYLLKEVIEPVEDSDHTEDAEALRSTLQRAVDALNGGVP